MKTVFFTVVATLVASVGVHAQITWAAAQPYTGTAADISTAGTFVAGVYENGSASGAPIAVGSMSFDLSSDSHIAGPGYGGGDGSGSTATPYLQILDGCTYVNVVPQGSPSGVSQVNTFTLQNLAAGDLYQVQVWNVTGYGGANNANGRETILSGTNTGDLVGSDFVLGTFTAGAGNTSFTMQGIPGGYYGEVDAVALRDLGAAPEPSTFAMLFSGVGALVLVARLRRMA
jgi:hypothetical protein